MSPLNRIRNPLLVSGLCAALWMGAAHALTETTSVREDLRQQISGGLVAQALHTGDIRLRAPLLVSQFYERRQFQPVWLGTDGPLPLAEQLVQALANAEQDGLRAADYHADKLNLLLAMAHSGGTPRLGELELLLTDVFFGYGSDLAVGRLNPRGLDQAWPFEPSAQDLGPVLEQAAAIGDLRQALAKIAPAHVEYQRLKAALAQYRELERQGGWPSVSAGKKRLELGASGERVKELRARLRSTGDLPAAQAEKGGEGDPEALFDAPVREAVKRFQSRHGIAANGVVGASTLAALNVPVAQRIRQLELNMERWRWVPADLGQRYILVNIPGFELNVFENGQRVLTSPVIVGRPDRPTPILSSAIDSLILSPYWHVPAKIALLDKLPMLRKNPYALQRMKIRVFGASGREINPGNINWRRVGAGNFGYQLRQDPGPRNALGLVKFQFPNDYQVYLHDTSSRELFSETQRAFSSGCVRVGKPIELAEYLLKEYTHWNQDDILARATSRRQQAVRLPQSVPVHLLYWTAWQSEDGMVQFRDDIYGRDRVLVQNLFADQPLQAAN